MRHTIDIPERHVDMVREHLKFYAEMKGDEITHSGDEELWEAIQQVAETKDGLDQLGWREEEGGGDMTLSLDSEWLRAFLPNCAEWQRDELNRQDVPTPTLRAVADALDWLAEASRSLPETEVYA